jgi:hypothetical protein
VPAIMASSISRPAPPSSVAGCSAGPGPPTGGRATHDGHNTHRGRL